MKNELKKALDRELQNVHVSSSLRARILSEAASARLPERRRRSPLPALAAAAAVLMAVALAAGLIPLRRGGANPPDPVLSQGDRCQVWISADDALYYHAQKNCGGLLCTETMNLSDAKAQGRTACPNCIRRTATPEPTLSPVPTEEPLSAQLLTEEPPELDPDATLAPTVMPTEAVNGTVQEVIDTASVGETVRYNAAQDLIVWTSEASSYYHRSEHCSLESSDLNLSEWECAEMGKLPCPECFPVEEVWMTDGGVYFHTARNCSSMENAYLDNRASAVAAGKKECSVCVNGSNVWTEPGDPCYHASEDCSSMTNAKEISETEAILNGKIPCSVCFLDLWEKHAGEGALNVGVVMSRPYLYVELQGDAQPAWIEQSIQCALDPPLDKLSDDTFTPEVLETFGEKLIGGEVCGAAAVSYSPDDLSLSCQDRLIEDSDLTMLCCFSTVKDGVQSCTYLLSYPDALTPDTLYLELEARGKICVVSGGNDLYAEDREIPFQLSSVTLNGAAMQSEVSFTQYNGLSGMLVLSPLESSEAGTMESHTFEEAGIRVSWLNVGDARFVYFTQINAQAASGQSIAQADAQVVYDSSDSQPQISVQFTDVETGSPVDAAVGDCMLNEGLAAYRLPDGADLADIHVSFSLNDKSHPYELTLS